MMKRVPGARYQITEENMSVAPVRQTSLEKLGNSQYHEDLILEKVFKTIGTQNRIALEVGAYDLEQNSNVYHLWKDMGWKSILIEGHPGRYHKMCQRYEALQAQGEVKGSVTLINRFVGLNGETSLDSLLSEINTPHDLDLMIIDVDGIDFHIWKSVEKFYPRVVMIEFNSSVPPHLSLVGDKAGNRFGASAKAFWELGKEKGYELIACTRLNMIFVQKLYAGSFENVGNLDKLFPQDALVYLISSYDGGILLTNSPEWGFNPFVSPVQSVRGAPLASVETRLFSYLKIWASNLITNRIIYPNRFLYHHLLRIFGKGDKQSVRAITPPLGSFPGERILDEQ